MLSLARAKIAISRPLKKQNGMQHRQALTLSHIPTTQSNCILHMSCCSHWFLHTNHMAAWHYDNFKPRTSREVNTRCSCSFTGVGNVSCADGGRFFISWGPVVTCPRGAVHNISSINIAVGGGCCVQPARLQMRCQATVQCFLLFISGSTLCFEATQMKKIIKSGKWIHPYKKKSPSFNSTSCKCILYCTKSFSPFLISFTFVCSWGKKHLEWKYSRTSPSTHFLSCF